MSSDSEAPDSESPLHELSYDSSADRLLAACRIGGVVLLVSPLLPFETVAGKPVFLWAVLGELHPATALAAFAPALCGAVLLGAARWLKRPSLLAFLTLLVLGSWSLVAKLGADAAAWDVAALPASLKHRIEPYVLGIALSGAALRLLAEPLAGGASRVVAGLSVLAGLGFGLLPGRGEAPVQTCLRFVGAVFELSDPRLVLGYGLLLTIAFFPLLAAGTALSLALAGRGRHTALFAELCTFGAPGLVFGLALQHVLATFGDASVVVQTAIAGVLAAVLALAARSIELVALFASGLGASSERERSPQPLRFLRSASALALLLVAATFVLSRPVKKGIDWPLGSRSEQADRLFGELMPKWALSRARWSLTLHGQASAAALAEARSAGNDLLRGSRALSPELGRAVGELVNGATELDLAGRRWFHLIEAVNEASRSAHLPYYLDPSLSSAQHNRDPERLFLLHPYRVEAVRRARADGTDYALLAVRQLGQARENHARLGFSRDHQAFALEVLDEIEPYASSLAELMQSEPPRCVDDETGAPELAHCGALLRKLAPTLEQVRRLVERHELQHQIDGPELGRSPAVLRALTGYEDAAIDEVNRELSAYLSELTAERVSPKLALVHVLPFSTTRAGSGLNFVVQLELSALSRRQHADAEAPDLFAIFDELAALPDSELRARAAEAHRKLFDAALPEVTF